MLLGWDGRPGPGLSDQQGACAVEHSPSGAPQDRLVLLAAGEPPALADRLVQHHDGAVRLDDQPPVVAGGGA